MGCRGYCVAEKLFIFVNIAFAMYAGALLSTAARLAWDPSTYTWFRWLCAAQYRVSAAYVLAAGLALMVLVSLAAAAVHPPPSPPRLFHMYACGVVALVLSEVGYGVWMVVTLVQWWQESPQAELARKGLDLVHDLKPVLVAVEKYQEVARAVYDMIEETEREAPNNVFVIIVFSSVGAVLQVVAFVLARRLAARGARAGDRVGDGTGDRVGDGTGKGRALAPDAGDAGDESDTSVDPSPPGWRKKTNLRMYTILDKIF